MKTLLHQETLATLDIFKSLPTAALEQIAQFSKIGTFKKDGAIYKSGDTIQHVHFVLDGKIMLGKKTSDDKVIIKDLVYSNKMFGENVFTKAHIRSEFATAMTESKVLMIPI